MSDASWPCSSAESSVSLINGNGNGNVKKMLDVFLSFRGPDTRHGFVRGLYDALVEEGIHTFLDQESLQKGDHIPTSLERGIAESRICIPIFSKNFPQSKSCLREVSLMVQCSAKICPLFYNVLPNVLRCPDGSEYAEQLKHHESQKGFSEELIHEFKHALNVVSDLCGWCFNQHNGRDDDFIREVVIDVKKSLNSKSSRRKVYLDLPKCFGLDMSVEHLKGSINAALHRKKFVKVGLHGMSGIGKTSLAKIVFRDLSFSEFEVFCFVPSVGERCEEANGIVKLQTQMLKSCASQFRSDEVDCVDEGKGLLQDSLRGKKVLLLLDDIESSEQLDCVAGNYKEFGAGSCVIITSRDEQILKVANVDVTFKVPRLSHEHAMELFKFHAFFPNSCFPNEELQTLSNDIVSACEGLPLALQLIGKGLVGELDRDVWREMVGKLRCEPNLHKILRLSYDSLDHSEKEMFQDIASYFTWRNKEIVMIFWEGLNIHGRHASLRNLLQKSILSLGPSNEFLMHRCLRDLGRSLSNEMHREPRKRTRLFDEDDAYRVLTRPTESAKVVHYLKYEAKEPMTLKAEMFKSLYNLRLLWLTDVSIAGHFSGEFPNLEELRWLSLRKYSSKRLPEGMNLQNLVILEVTDSQITHLWDESAEENPTRRPGNLKVLILRGCESLKSLPTGLCYTAVQVLDLHNCHSLSSLADTVRSWTSLVILDMKGCSVSSLPQDFGELPNLQELDLSYCQNLSKLPDSLGNLVKLEKLEIQHNHKLKELPESIGGLKCLACLDMSYCHSLSVLPNTLGCLISLVCLEMEGCGVLCLPRNLCNLPSLEELNISSCEHLSELPPSLGDLSKLAILQIHHIPLLRELPKSLGSLQKVRELNLVGCNSISSASLQSCFSGLPALECVLVGGPSFSSHQLRLFYDSFRDFSFSEGRLLDNSGAPAKWVEGEAGGKKGCVQTCVDYCTGENKKVEYCAGYSLCLLCSAQTQTQTQTREDSGEVKVKRLSYSIEREIRDDGFIKKCAVKSENSSRGGGDYFELRLVRVEGNMDFAWLKSGNKVRVNATSDYDNWHASFKFLMYHTTLTFQERKPPNMVTFVM